jgi:hypothetical protein
MEGDAGASRLNPPPMSMISRLRRRRPKIRQESDDAPGETSPEVTAEDSSESEVGADQTSPEVTAEDSSESEVGADQTSPEVTAEDSSESEVGAEAVAEPAIDAAPAAEAPDTPDAEPTAEAEAASAEAPEVPDAEDDEVDAEATTEDPAEASADAAGTGRPPSRVGRGWLAGIAAVLVLLAGVVGVGGYLALRYHHDSQVVERNNAAALKAAIDCVAATQAPDTNAMIASEQKIIDCGTDAFRAQAVLYTGMLVQAYQSANVHVEVADVRAAVERNNRDGSIEVLVAMRVKVLSDQSQNETGYRLRVKMALDEGKYRIAKLDQVTK